MTRPLGPTGNPGGTSAQKAVVGHRYPLVSLDATQGSNYGTLWQGVDGRAVPIPIVPSHLVSSPKQVFYLTADCSGPGYLPGPTFNGGEEPESLVVTVRYTFIANNMFYYSSGPAQNVTAYSVLNSFSPRVCRAITEGYYDALTSTETVDLSAAFVAPFHIELNQ